MAARKWLYIKEYHRQCAIFGIALVMVFPIVVGDTDNFISIRYRVVYALVSSTECNWRLAKYCHYHYRWCKE